MTTTVTITDSGVPHRAAHPSDPGSRHGNDDYRRLRDDLRRGGHSGDVIVAEDLTSFIVDG